MCQSGLICELVNGLLQHSEMLLLVTITIATVYAAWQDGYEKGLKKGQVDGEAQGFVEGIMHHIQMRAYNAADFPNKYQEDPFVLEAQKRLAKNLSPVIPKALRHLL